MSNHQIKIAKYDPSWISIFESEKAFLRSIVNPWLHGTIEHVGSTAIVGLAAKPVVDIMVGIKSLEESYEAIEALTSNGYNYYPYKTEVMYWFCKPTDEIITHHLHLVPYESPLWLERIAFRDCIRNNADLAVDYEKLKRQLAERFRNDRDAYSKGKWPFIKQVLDTVNHNRS